jgi:hypothetical protein
VVAAGEVAHDRLGDASSTGPPCIPEAIPAPHPAGASIRTPTHQDR